MMTREHIFWLLITGVLALGGHTDAISNSLQSVPGIAPGYGAIEGRVLDEMGRAVPGAKVSSMILDRPPGRMFSAETDAEGRFSLRYARPGRNAIYVGKEGGYYPDTFLSPFVDPKLIPVVTVSEQSITAEIEVRLPPRGGKVVARVIDAATQQPIDGASMTFCKADNPSKCVTINATSPNAKFETLMPSIRLTVKVSALGYQTWHYRDGNASSRAGKILLTPGSTKDLTILLRPQSRKLTKTK